MVKLVAIGCCLLFALGMLMGCSAEKEAEPQTGAAGEPEEVADTTRMDPAMADTMMADTAAVMETPVDTTGQ